MRFIDAFRGHVAKRPDASALEDGDVKLSYQELDEWSDAVMLELQRRGAGPGKLVAVHASRSVRSVLALLACIKSGATYVPVDTSYPAARIRLILDRVRDDLACVAFDKPLGPEYANLPALDLRMRVESTRLRPSCETPEGGLAYLVFTSGSTGTPKGVMIENASVDAVVPHLVHCYGIGPEDRVLHMAPLGFDTSISEVLRTLWAGACLCVASAEEVSGPRFLSRLAFLNRHAVSCAVLPTSLLRTLGRVELPSLRSLVVTGEACTSALVERWAPGRRLLNAYGSTETTFASTVMVLDRSFDGDRVPVGRPIPSAEVLVLDAASAPSNEPGAEGEICIGGAGVARGYYRDPILTRERFVTLAGRRFFRTGDHGRFLPTGELECLGRLDNQVKVRGSRVDLEEVERVLRDFADVHEAVVSCVPTGYGGSALVAHLVGGHGEYGRDDQLIEAIKEHAAACLPPAAVPQHYAVRSSLPRGVHAKVDRHALHSDATARFGRPL